MAVIPEGHQSPTRRRVLQSLGIGGAVLAIGLPTRWTRPVVESIIVPAHAAASPVRSTSSTTSTTRTTATSTSCAPFAVRGSKTNAECVD
jgi:hypothetical protein